MIARAYENENIDELTQRVVVLARELGGCDERHLDSERVIECALEIAHVHAHVLLARRSGRLHATIAAGFGLRLCGGRRGHSEALLHRAIQRLPITAATKSIHWKITYIRI